jgi:hypothetical protein
MVITGCVSTSLQVDWKDPSFKRPFKKVLIICIVKENIVRSTLESDLAAQFTSRGVEAVPSNTILYTLRDVNRETVMKKVSEIDADGVLLIRPIGHETTDKGGYDLYDQPYSASDSDLAVEVYRIQSSLFETANGKVIWRALSDTIVGGAWTETLNKFAKVIGAKLIEHGLI